MEAEGPMGEALKEAAEVPVAAAALTQVERPMEEAFSAAAAFVAAGTLTSAGVDILPGLPAALGVGRPCGPLIWAGDS